MKYIIATIFFALALLVVLSGCVSNQLKDTNDINAELGKTPDQNKQTILDQNKSPTTSDLNLEDTTISGEPDLNEIDKELEEIYSIQEDENLLADLN